MTCILCKQEEAELWDEANMRYHHVCLNTKCKAYNITAILPNEKDPIISYPPEEKEKPKRITCQDCFFRNNRQCRRFPPVLARETGALGSNIWSYPVVTKKDWCGEAKAR